MRFKPLYGFQIITAEMLRVNLFAVVIVATALIVIAVVTVVTIVVTFKSMLHKNILGINAI